MSFNFGAQTLKYPPGGGFSAVSTASKNNVKDSEGLGSGGTVAVMKKVNNAPQAIIIEVSQFFFDLKILFHHISD